MIQKSLFKRAFILLFIVGALSVIDRNLYLTWNFWWFDKLMHFSAGAVVGMTMVLFFIYFSKFLDSRSQMIMLSLIGVLMVGLLWEWFELYFDITSLSDGIAYYKDTFGDLFMDLLGGYLSTLYSFNFIKK